MKKWSNPSIVLQHIHANSTRNLIQRPVESLKSIKKDRPSNPSLKKPLMEHETPKAVFELAVDFVWSNTRV